MRLTWGTRWLDAAATLALVCAGCATSRGDADEATGAPGARGGGTAIGPRAGAAAMRGAFGERGERVLSGGGEVELEQGVFHVRGARSRGAGARSRRLGVELPEGSGEPVVFRTGDLEIRVREEGLAGSGEIVERAVAYERAGGTAFWSFRGAGAEEWLHLSAESVREGEPVAAWEIEGAELFSRGDAVALRDEDGRARLWVTAPVGFARGGRALSPRLAVTGSRIELYVDADEEEVLIDPGWTTVAPMLEARGWHVTATLLDGRILAAGGQSWNTEPLASAEIYDPALNTWSPLPDMMVAHWGASAFRLPSGKVLVAGGTNPDETPTPAKLFNPATGTWQSANGGPELAFMAAGVLSSGEVLFAGGATHFGPPLASAAIYDPKSGAWKTAAPMANPRIFAALWPLPDGRALVVGGAADLSVGGALASCEIYDPATDTWSPAAPMGTTRSAFASATLPSGKLLVAGGEGKGDGFQLSTAEVFDPGSGAWSPIQPMLQARSYPMTGSFLDGRVLVAGGGSGFGGLFNSMDGTEIYDESTDSWSSAGLLSVPRMGGGLVPLGAVDLVLVGGDGGNLLGNQATVDVYTSDLPIGGPCGGPEDCEVGYCTDGVCCAVPACTAVTACSLAGVCQPGTGLCSAPMAPDGAPCDDGDGCSTGDVCQSGSCVANGPKVVCEPSMNACQVPACDSATGTCVGIPEPDGKPCDAGVACASWTLCMSGQCTIVEYKQCTSDGECSQSGYCDSDTGACEYPSVPDGTPCSEGVCQSGVCGPEGVGGSGGSGGSSGGGGGKSGEQVVKGCSCEAAGRSGSDVSALAGLLLGLLAVVRRRRPENTD